LSRAISGVAASASPELSGPEDHGDLLALRELGDGIHRLGRSLWRIAADQLDHAAVDAAGLVDLLDGKLGAAVDADAGRGARAGQRRQVADLDRLVGGDGGRGEATGQRHAPGGGAGKNLATLDGHCRFLPYLNM
jgi:hypothetical protein